MERILVRTPQWLGDAVVGTSFLYRLKAKNPQADIHVLSPAYLVPLYLDHPAISSVISIAPSERNRLGLIKTKLQPLRFDRAYILPRSLRTALEAWWARIPRRIGFKGDGRAWLLTEAETYDPALPYPQRYLRLIGEEDFPPEKLQFSFPIEEPFPADLHRLLGEGRELPKPWLAVGPASVAPARTWAPDRFAETARRYLQTSGGSALVFGSRSEQAVTAAVTRQINGRAVDLGGKLSLPHLGWFLKQCERFVGNDSGLMHVATALNVPGVVIFGASDPTVALPQAGRFRAVQHPEIYCVPCLKNECIRAGGGYKECLRVVSVDQVVEELKALHADR